eukprot:2779698-Alexandrium_andersonii.AAC.1
MDSGSTFAEAWVELSPYFKKDRPSGPTTGSRARAMEAASPVYRCRTLGDASGEAMSIWI